MTDIKTIGETKPTKELEEELSEILLVEGAKVELGEMLSYAELGLLNVETSGVG